MRTFKQHLTESTETDLLATLQKEVPNVRRVTDVIGKFDAQELKHEVSVAKRLKDNWTDVRIDGKRVTLPTEQAEELLKIYQRNMRGMKSYVQSRW